MAKGPKYLEGGESSVPRSFPEVTPRFTQPGHDFTLQAIMEMKESVGQLSAKTDRLISDVKSQGDKIDGMRLKFAWVTGGVAVVGFLFAVILALIKFIPSEYFLAK
jgi:hypothetical protein